MAPDQTPDKNQITFTQEIFRKATHMCALVIPGGYYLLGLEKAGMLAIMIPVALLMVLIDVSRLRQWLFWRSFARPIVSSMIRQHEKDGDFTGATYILASFCLTIALYSKPIAIAALTFIVVGDTFAALIGRRFGRHRFGNKSFEGSAACLVTTVIVALLMPGIALPVVLFGAVVATVVEALPFGIDDNVTVPILSGLFMTLFERIFHFFAL
ncbi:MAG: phosphatidate cytidylyltransferase [candidate division Zixibacteria bacterium]|nr:phosphatidate cytidylyltransferase [candidate division Zixibacteria bacterium]